MLQAGEQCEQSGGRVPHLRLLIFNLANRGPLPWVPQFVKKIYDQASV